MVLIIRDVMNCFVKESYGAMWHFYHNAHGICYCKMTDENITEYSVLLPEGQADFDVLVDDSNCIHMVLQTNSGDILYANHFNGQWRKTTLLESKSKEYYPKKIVLKRVNNWLNVLYCIEYNGRKMLTHQLVDSALGTPEVIDCIRNEFCCVQDSSGNIILLYYSELHKAYGIKKYIWSKKKWDEFEKIKQPEGGRNLFLFCDKNDVLHILYDKNFNIYKISGDEELLLGTGQKPLMFFHRENIIMWEGVSDNKVYVKEERDNAPTVIMSGSFSRPVRFGLRFTTYEDNLIADCCLGNIINGSVRMYGINNFFVISHTSPISANSSGADDNFTYREMQKLKIKIDRLNEIVEKLQMQAEEYEGKKTDHHLTETVVNKPKLFGLF
ncbi:MAG: hypothetical protein II244_00570 [Clostridia bacterium]|nr:hypothetical protein [Clostridia bacterium]